MDKKQAREIVRDTLGEPFAKEAFTRLAKELFNQIDEAKAFHARGYVPESYKKYVKTYERLATYTDPDGLKIDLLIVYLQSETTLERARTSQRNFIAHYLKDRDQKDAGLVAFVSPDPSDWRFSLVKMDYRFAEGKGGKIKAKEEFTPARRWSFLVGQNENSHTAQSRLAPIIADDTHNPKLADLEEAFNIETVTKEFFTEYRNLFLRVKEALDAIVAKDATIKNNFEQNGVNTVDFAKKLLGQIVFLYFLQKKGWFGVARDAQWGTGSKHFLRELFEQKHGGFKNFFNDILEPLFYEALRLDRGHEDHYYSQFNCKIPFLNGGLFDPINGYDWAKTDILIANELFSNSSKTKQGDDGDGILDVFDRYNFTVKEDEPLEKEVAIDPELLGKAYEKFNAIRPDNFDEFQKALKSGKKGDESKFNKQFGVYYTPREIVHYMCQQSLINYLFGQFNDGTVTYEKPGVTQTNMLGNTGKKGQLDLIIEHKERPAIPKEDIETLIHYGERLSDNEEMALIKQQKINDGQQKTSDYKLQLPDSIRNNAEEIDDKLLGIKVCDPAIGSGAFPVGMMSEIVRARNTLSTFIKNTNRSIYHFKRDCIENSLYGVDIDSGAVEIAKLRLWLSLVVDEDDIRQIKPLPNLDYKIVCGNSLLGLPADILPDVAISKEIEEKKKQYFSTTSPSEKNNIRETINGLFSQLMDNIKKYDPTVADINFDFHTHFSEVFHEKDGFDVVIANPPYVVLEKKDFNESYRFIKGNNNTYIAFLEKALMHISINGVISYIIPTTWLAGNNYRDIRKYLLLNRYINQIIQLPYDVFENAYVDSLILILTGNNKKNDEALTFKFQINEEIRGKIEYDRFVIEDWLNDSEQTIYLNKKLSCLLRKYKNKESVKLGLIADIQRGTLPPKENDFFKDSSGDKQLVTWYDGQIYRYITTKGSGLKIKYDKLKENKPIELFKCKKILGRQLISRQFRLQFSFFDEPAAFKKNLYAIYNIKGDFHFYYLLAILNSAFYSYVQVNQNASGQRDDYPAFSLQDYKNFLIPVLPNSNQKLFISFVDEILTLTLNQSDDYLQNRDQQAKVKEYEKEIDKMVYKLYDLTPEEIKIVEGNESS